MNAILRYVFLVLTSKVSMLQREEERRDDPYKSNTKIDLQKLSQMIEVARLESKTNSVLAQKIRQIRETFPFAMYKEPEFIDFKSNFSEYQLGLSALRKISHMEESLQKYHTVLLNKVYDREKLSYGFAKDPLRLGEK